MAHMFAAWSRMRRSKQPAACARKVLLNRHPSRTAVPGRAFPACEPCHRGWNRTLVPSSGEDLRPWWPTARYLTKVDADLVPSAEQSMA